MLDSLVRVSRRVLRVPETESSQTETRTVRDYTAATKQRRRAGVRTRAGRRRRRSACVGPDALGACAIRIEAYSVSIPSDADRPPHRFDGDARTSPPDSRAALRWTSNGSRCITKREVHAVDGRRRTRPVRTVTRERPVRIEARARTPPK